MRVSPEECAREVLEVVPLIMRVIRAEMRRQRTPDLSVPQFRVLNFISHHEGASLRDAAENIGLTLPSTSTMINRLVMRNLVERQASTTDRRCITLTLTEEGKSLLEAAHRNTQAHLVGVLAALSAEEQATVVQAMRSLRPILTPDRKAGTRKCR